MRLQKYLAMSGVASRRKCEALILSGQVTINGVVVTEMGVQIDPMKDQIAVNQKLVKPEAEQVYILMNKPVGYITTVSDQFNRKKVTDLLAVKERVFPVGRLDYDTSGLLLLTNDGDLAYKLTHPKFKVEKVYLAKIKGKPTLKELKDFEQGLAIEDYITSPAKIRVLRSHAHESLVEITIREGRNRQVRKMCAAINHPVLELKRLSMGDLTLGELQPGQWRFLTQIEVQYLKNL